MPGIFGIYKKDCKEAPSDLMERMSKSMNPNGNCRSESFFDKRGTVLGRVSLGVFNYGKQPVINTSLDSSLIFHGELYDNNSGLSDPEHMLKQYLVKGDAFATDLNGIFHLAICDYREQKIKLFSDKFGLQPLYYSILQDGIIFAGEIKAILCEHGVSKEPDYSSFADFYHYGQILGDKTLFRDIKLLSPGAILSYDFNNNSYFVKKYWDLQNLFIGKESNGVEGSIGTAVSAFIDSINTRKSNLDLLGLSLSGGLDSRGILAGLKGDARGLNTYTLGLSGCADEKLAGKMATVSGTRHEFIVLDQNYIGNFEHMATDMIRLSDGMYHPHESTEMLALEYFKRAKFKILLRGHGGEIAKAALAYPVMVNQEVNSFVKPEEILNYIFKITNLVLRDVETEKLFTRDLSDVMKTAPRESLEKSCGEASKRLIPADVCIYYYINEHIRRQVVSSLDIFRTQIEIRMPYVDEQYIREVLKLPLSMRNTGEIHFEIIKRCMPELIKIPNSNTGAPLDAGKLRLFVVDKFNSVLKRLSIKGFRHYTEFQKWHREGFKNNTQNIIFNELTGSRKIYNMDYLKEIFDLHVSGQKNYAHLLGTIVGLELWFRNFVD